MSFKRGLCDIGVLEAAAGCNLRCASCVAWTEKGKDLITEEIIEKAMPLFKRVGVKQVQMYWRGDPCIHPRLPEMNEIVLRHGMKTIVSTNGVTKHCGNPEYMRKLLNTTTHYAVCLDGHDAESLAKYRIGAKWDRMINNLEIASKIDSNCDKILAVLMFKYNEGKEHIFEEIAKKYGFRVDFKAPNVLGEYILTEDQANEWLAESPKYSRYDKTPSKDIEGIKWRGNDVAPKNMGEYVYIHRNADNCTSGNIIVAANGDIPICGQFTKEINGLGNVFDPIDNILARYAGINEDMYDRKLKECSEKCLCIVKPR
jgi:MoaA/NifB/PqqE/SkfB family radical SAM enzyme